MDKASKFAILKDDYEMVADRLKNMAKEYNEWYDSTYSSANISNPDWWKLHDKKMAEIKKVIRIKKSILTMMNKVIKSKK